ncbi:MAG: LPS assembly lipoprotein LptE [Prolixibacteraceae bacterium]|jgi:hypothetical protein|nr:LPS assembly lipoprotein LptE [Prolixibacteraceae bacterium]
MKQKNLIVILLLFVLGACSIKYSFTGASISPLVKTYTIYDFPNRARMINPTLSDYFVEQLSDKFTRQTSLDYQNDGGDLEFEGTITGYDIQPISVQEGDVTALNRLTIQIKVTFRNNQDPEQDFETEFSAYDDFSSEFNISDVEDELVEAIVKQIIDEIYNKSVANW